MSDKPSFLFRVYDQEADRFVEDEGDFLMEQVGFDIRMRFDSVAIDTHGSLMVLDRCGNCAYLDTERFKAVLAIDWRTHE